MILALVSVMIGVSDVSLSALLPWADGETIETARDTIWVSRLPRTLALILAGTAMGVCGLLMQLLVRNRFVEPGTVGTTEAASLGLLAVTMLAPGMPLIGKMGVASLFALGGTYLFLLVIRSLPTHNTVLVPLVGMMLGGVVGAVTTYIAFSHDLLMSLNAWMTGDFSGVLQGRYELLWIVGVLTVMAYIAADRFTMAGLGDSFATNAGLNYRAVMAFGFALLSIASATVVVTVGSVPFLGLVVPNIVSLIMGDNVRRSIPWVALLGAALVLVCDIVGRVIRWPYEIPIGLVMGVVGAAVFLYLLLRRVPRAAA